MQCHQGELPDLATVDQYTGIFITGSPASANDTEQKWIQKQKQWVTAFAGGQRQCKLVASCYGCQVICSMAANTLMHACKEIFLHEASCCYLNPDLVCKSCDLPDLLACMAAAVLQ